MGHRKRVCGKGRKSLEVVKDRGSGFEKKEGTGVPGCMSAHLHSLNFQG
jgi:hypothetical protein